MKMSTPVSTALNAQFAIPVLRHRETESLIRISNALAEGGLTVIEITVMNDAALKAIKELSREPSLIIGAGTLLNSAELKRARDNGAKFFVSPGLDESSLEYAAREKLDFAPGTLTPTEVMKAKAHGFEVAKIFPVRSVGGPNYIKMLGGPFPTMKWIPSGGIAISDMSEYIKLASVLCVGVGSSLHPKEMVENANWLGITHLAREVADEVSRGRGH